MAILVKAVREYVLDGFVFVSTRNAKAIPFVSNINRFIIHKYEVLQ